MRENDELDTKNASYKIMDEKVSIHNYCNVLSLLVVIFCDVGCVPLKFYK